MAETTQRRSAKAWLRLVLAVMVAQAIFWGLFDPWVSARPDVSAQIPIERMEVATIDAPTADAIAKARFTEVDTPWSDCCTGGYRVARYHFSLGSIPRDGFVAASVGVADNLEIYVNRQLAYTHGRMGRANPTYHGANSQFFSFPSALFHPGENTIDVVLVRAKMPWFDAGFMVLGERARLIAGFDARNAMVNTFPLVSVGIGIVLALLATVIGMRSHDRATALWTALTATSWVLWTSFYHWDAPPFGPEGRLLYYFACANLTPLCWLGLINSWSGRNARWLTLGLLTTYLATLAEIWWQLHLGGEGGYDAASDITNYVSLVALATTVLSFLWHFRRGADLRIAESAILAVCVTVLACEFYWEMRWQEVFGRIATAGIPFLLVFVVAFLARNVRLFQSSEQINALLQVQLDQRTAELEAAHLRERELVRVQAHQAERHRIMQDMHDGLGSQLMSMLLAARRGVAKPAAVAEGLQSVIDEMRLLIDSMDSVGESLGSAFAIFRERVEPRVVAAGMDFAWNDETAGQLPDYGPRDVLQVFRIMQEAVTNALKHSGGKALAISVIPSPDPVYAVRLAIADDGGGLGKANRRGKGLTSMETRASNIGGRLEIVPTSRGVTVLLDLPAARSGAAMP